VDLLPDEVARGSSSRGAPSGRSSNEDALRDRAAIRAVAGGSGDAVAELYDRYGGTVYGLALRVLGQPDLAEEVVQDVFAQVWREAGRYDANRSTVAGWIVMLTRTRSIDRLRARKARPDLARGVDPIAAAPLPSPESTPEASTLIAEDTRLVRGALARLPDHFRSLIELAYYEGLSHTEIAARTGIPVGTVKTRLRSAMGTLRSVLA
jgi:RNA polymerase sigma-70 factor (ECF subfamily)